MPKTYFGKPEDEDDGKPKSKRMPAFLRKKAPADDEMDDVEAEANEMDDEYDEEMDACTCPKCGHEGPKDDFMPDEDAE